MGAFRRGAASRHRRCLKTLASVIYARDVRLLQSDLHRLRAVDGIQNAPSPSHPMSAATPLADAGHAAYHPA